MKLYHYTNLRNLAGIIADGTIRRTESNVSRKRAHAAPDVVWLLDVPQLDRTHGLVIPGPDGTIPLMDPFTDKTQVRITVNVAAAVRWLQWGPVKGMDPRWLRAIVDAGGGWSAARHWWVTESAIPRSRWLAVEVRTEGNWTPEFGAEVRWNPYPFQDTAPAFDDVAG